jgi:hypothetical protein
MPSDDNNSRIATCDFVPRSQLQISKRESQVLDQFDPFEQASKSRLRDQAGGPWHGFNAIFAQWVSER